MLKRNVTDLLTTWEALSALCRHFQVSEPKLIFGRTRRGWYRVSMEGKSISVPDYTGGGSGGWTIANTLLHEFAHHLHYTRKGVVNHGADFHQALTDVAAAWYGNPAEYAWHLEYATLKAAGPAPHPDLKIDTDKLLGELL